MRKHLKLHAFAQTNSEAKKKNRKKNLLELRITDGNGPPQTDVL